MFASSSCSNECRVLRYVQFESIGKVVYTSVRVIASRRQYLQRHWGRTKPGSCAIVPVRWSSDNDRGT